MWVQYNQPYNHAKDCNKQNHDFLHSDSDPDPGEEQTVYRYTRARQNLVRRWPK